jgi:hypothetical protein
MLSRLPRLLGKLFAGLIGVLLLVWAAGALWFDLPAPTFVRGIAAVAFLVILVMLWVSKGMRARLVALVLLAGLVTWWFMLNPRNDRSWQPDVKETAWAEINGDAVTLHNVRNCDYRTETDYTPRWETRAVRLSQLTGVDLAIDYWGSPHMAHPIASFQFAGARPICFSIETRKEVGESYSAIGGLYRQFELIYIVADERDVLRVRTNYRKGEDIYLYRLTMSPEDARVRFMDYVTALNELHNRPRWYNAVTTNCTTSIRTQHASDRRASWDWRMLVNGYMDQMLFEQGALRTGGLPFPELKTRSLINERARAAHDSPDFSARIRAGVPGFAAAR